LILLEQALFQKSERKLVPFFVAKNLHLALMKEIKLCLLRKKMKEKNKFLSRTRDREKWKRKLSGQYTNALKADSIYFRPTLADDKRIRDLAELMGETKNSIVEKLVSGALNNRQLLTKKFDEQNGAIRHLEDQTEIIAGGQVEILTMLDEIRRKNALQESLTASLLSEIYCMVHTAVSLIRTVLVQMLGLTAREASKTPLAPEVLTSFDETSDLSIVRSLQDLESAAAFHQIKTGRFTGENLFWKLKLKCGVEDPKQK
jgi:hypothetical protein